MTFVNSKWFVDLNIAVTRIATKFN